MADENEKYPCAMFLVEQSEKEFFKSRHISPIRREA
jgi:hypothetical protein